MIPIGDSPNPRGFVAWVNLSLIAVNVGVFVLLWPLSLQRVDPRDPAFVEYVTTIGTELGARRDQLPALARQIAPTRYDLVVFEHGFRPARPSIADLFTAMFLHGGWMHLLGNMLFLWIYGDNVEHRLGRIGYLALYLATGIAAGLGDALLRAGSEIPSVGASGAISGVLGMYFLWFPRNRIQMLMFFPFGLVFELPARLVLGFYILADNLLPALLGGGRVGGVSYGAHIGGFVAGVVAAFIVDRMTVRRPEPSLRAAGARVRGSDPVRLLRDALARGDLATATGVVLELPARQAQRIPAGDLLDLARHLESAGHARGALAVLHRVLASRAASGEERARAHLATARLMIHHLDLPAEAYQHLHAAARATRDPALLAEIQELLDEIAAHARRMPRR